MGSEERAPVVTLSAPYGAGGSVLGPRLADALGVPFLDRAIPSGVAHRLAVPLARVAEHDECVPKALDRLLLSFAAIGPAFAGGDFLHDVGDRSFVDATNTVIREHASTTGGVILGRAGACVLRDHPGATHVRLTGPAHRRIEQAMAIEGVDRATARRRLREVDASRDAYVRYFHRADPHDAGLYHLVLDTTAVPLDDALDILVRAARSFPRAGALAAAG